MTKTNELISKSLELSAEATSEPWLERKDIDYYQGGLYLGNKGYSYKNGQRIPGDDYFEIDVCRIESGDQDKDFIMHSRTALPRLAEALKVAMEALQGIYDLEIHPVKASDYIEQIEKIAGGE